MMSRPLSLAALAAGLLAAGTLHAQSTPLATVNGVPIPAKNGEFLFQEQAPRAAGRAPDQIRSAVREDLINREVILQEARRTGLLKKPAIDTEYELAQQATIVRLYMREWIRANPVSEDEMRKAYEDTRARAPEKEYRARHVLLETEDEAKKAIAGIKGGAKFEELAKQSRDTGTRATGGDLGWVITTAFDKAFGDAVLKLQKGQMTEAPVKTQFGWHVIRLEDVRPLQMPAFEQLKPRILQQLTQRKIEGMVRDLRAKAKVE